MRYFLSFLLCCLQGYSASVYMTQNDIARTGANLAETTLTQANVARSLGKRGSFLIDGYPWAQPLYVSAVTIDSVVHNVLLVVTSTNHVYAFDADDVTIPSLWSLNLGTPFTNSDTNMYDSNTGITGTPVIDPATNVVYFVSCASSGTYSIHAVSLADGTDFHAPVNISATVSAVTFVGSNQLQRPGLLLLAGKVYMGFGSYADLGTWYGWIFAYDKTNLSQTNAFIVTPTSNKASIWMSGGGISSDGTSIFVMSGNNSSSCAPSNYGESVINLDTSLTVIDYMTPSNCPAMDSADNDLGSSRALISGNYVLGGGKDGRFWVLNKGALGSNQGSGPPIAQVWQLGSRTSNSIFEGYVFANGTLFINPHRDAISAFSCPSTCNTTPIAQSLGTFRYSSLSYSSNGSTPGTGIVWAQTSTTSADTSPVTGTFTAYNADTMAILYTDPLMGILAKFNKPTIVDGKIYVATFSGTVNLYEMITQVSITGQSQLVGNASIQ